jgi:hypothetical protein
MKNQSSFRQRKQRPVFHKADYRLILELYYLNKAAIEKEASLPIEDYRRICKKKSSATKLVSLRKAFLKIAAIW